MDALQAGTRIDAYVIERLLSDKGGFSLVYRARHPRLGQVAIKECAIAGHVDRRGTVIIPRPERRADFDWARARFRQEARFLMGSGRHQHIVHAHDMIEANDTIYLVMELLEESLDQRLARDGEWHAPSFSKGWLDQIGGAPAFFEKQECYHLDIAPKNVMFDAHGEARLIDFGFSRLGNASRMRSTRLATTDGYSPVEKYSFSSRDLDARTDVYSLAATLVRVLAGEEPIDSRTRQNRPAFLSPEADQRLSAAIGRPGYDVLAKALSVQRSERYLSAHAFLTAWNAATAHPAHGGGAGKPRILIRPSAGAAPPRRDRVRVAPGQRRKLAATIGVGVVTFLVLIWTLASW